MLEEGAEVFETDSEETFEVFSVYATEKDAVETEKRKAKSDIPAGLVRNRLQALVLFPVFPNAVIVLQQLFPTIRHLKRRQRPNGPVNTPKVVPQQLIAH